MRSLVVLAGALAGLTTAAIAAPGWTVEASEIAYLFYGEPSKPVLSIFCGQEDSETGRDETRIEVEAEPGAKPGPDKAVLVVEQDDGRKEVPLEARICGGENECADQPDGEVSRYETSVPGKTLALDIAHKGRALAVDAPGVKISAPADAAAFKKFAASCLNW